MEKILDTIAIVFFKTLLLLVQFGVWFFALGVVSKVAGSIVGCLSALLLLAFYNIKRERRG
jgi:hypothetical protein